jgi:hypothetical protein
MLRIIVGGRWLLAAVTVDSKELVAVVCRLFSFAFRLLVFKFVDELRAALQPASFPLHPRRLHYPPFPPATPLCQPAAASHYSYIERGRRCPLDDGRWRMSSWLD